jgi:DUF4097 and DUF4098 domain-containing protein YvlB
MRKAVIFIGLAALVAASVGARAGKEDFEWSGGSGAKTFIVRNVNGDINVTARGDVIVIKAKKTSDDPEDLGKVDIVVSEVGSTVEAAVEYPERPLEDPNVKVDFDVKIPENVKLRAYVVSGDVTVSGVSSASIESTSGNVNVSEGYEYVKVSAVNGTVIVDNEDYPTEYLKATTVNGNIGLNLSLPESDGEYGISSVHGDISVNLFGEANNYDAEIESLSGTVETELPLEEESGIVGTIYEGTAGAGTNEIDIYTVSGSIMLKMK